MDALDWGGAETAKALKVPVEELFGEPSDSDPVTITRTSMALARNRALGEPRVVAGTAPGHRMLAFVLQPGKGRERGHLMSHHEGEEILYVLKGAITLQLADRSEALEAGDCAHFNSAVPHKITSRGEEPAEVLLVIAA